MWGSTRPTRSETLQVTLTLNKGQTDRHRIISGKSPEMIEFNIHYTFTAGYYGDIEEKFGAIMMILAIERRADVRERPDSQHHVP